MKEQGYRTNCCNQLKDLDSVYGIIDTNDMFDQTKRFKTVHPDKTNIHYCVECYTQRVTNVVNQTVRRKNNEEKYQEKLKEYTYIFKNSLFMAKF